MTQPVRTAETGSDRHVDVWVSYYDEIDDERLHAQYRALLSPEERHQELRFHFRNDQQRYLITRAMARTVLSRYVSMDPRAWRFVTNRYGRPEIVNRTPEAAGLEFNISHTRGLIALGIARCRDIGVDVEDIRACEVPRDIADRCLAASERIELARVPPHERHTQFLEYWTLKESYIKARGMGLSIPLDQFSFQYPRQQAVRISIAPQLRDDADRWCFWQYNPTPRHLLAICVRRRPLERLVLTIRRVVPLVSEEVVDSHPRRSSVQ